MEIKINQEIKEYNETMFFGLSVRQFIFALLACGAAVGIYFGCRSFLETETLSWLCIWALLNITECRQNRLQEHGYAVRF